MNTATKTMWVEVAYAKPAEQVVLRVDMQEGAAVLEAILQSGILQQFPEIDLDKNPVGIFSKPCKLDQTLKAGDRVEIYRNLLVDPKESRRNRAARHQTLLK